MAYGYLLDPTIQFIDESGKPLTGGWVEVYLHDTTIKYVTKADFNGTSNPFKVALDSRGHAILIANDINAYDVFIYDSLGSQVMSASNVTVGGTANAASGMEYWTGPFSDVTYDVAQDGSSVDMTFSRSQTDRGNTQYNGIEFDDTNGRFSLVPAATYLVTFDIIASWNTDNDPNEELRVWSGMTPPTTFIFDVDRTRNEAGQSFTGSFMVRSTAQNNALYLNAKYWGNTFSAQNYPKAYFNNFSIVRIA